jgi:hypothetical protein
MSDYTGYLALFAADAALRMYEYCFHTPVPFSKPILKQSLKRIFSCRTSFPPLWKPNEFPSYTTLISIGFSNIKVNHFEMFVTNCLHVVAAL